MTDNYNLINQRPLFGDADTERFVRLVVYDNNDNKLYGSHTCNAFVNTQSGGDNEITDNVDDGSGMLNILNNVKVPQDYSEWYFMSAIIQTLVNIHLIMVYIMKIINSIIIFG